MTMTGAMIDPPAEPLPRLKARIAGVFYLVTFVTGLAALAFHRGSAPWFVVNLVADAAYLVVTALFYELFKPVNRKVSLIAALFSLGGIVLGVLNLFHVAPLNVNSLVFFGFYCLLLGYLIHRSTFLPHVLGALMALAGLGWLTFISPPLAKQLSPFNMLPGVFGEGALALWLLLVGLNADRWREQAGAPGV